MSELSVDKITGKTGTGGSNSPLQFSGDTVTLGTGTTIGTGATIGSTPFNATLANATFPAGHIINVYTVTASDDYGTSAQTWLKMTTPEVVVSAANGFSMSATSKLFLMGTVQVENHANCAFDFYKNATGFTETWNLTGETYGFGLYTHSDTTKHHRDIMTMTHLDVAGTTNDITYAMAMISYDTSNTVYLGRDDTLTSLTVMEIAV